MSEAPETQRLQKFLARAGVASRRACEELIVAGRVSVDGAVVNTLGTKVDPTSQTICVDGKPISLPELSTTIMLHKPAGYVTTMEDPQGRPTVADLVPTDHYPGLYPVGRLDTDTTGLLLFTTDGELGNGLLHPRHHVAKRYLFLVEGTPSDEDLERLRQGIQLSDGRTQPAEVSLAYNDEACAIKDAIGYDDFASGQRKRHGGKRRREQMEKEGSFGSIILHEGRKRQVRRMFETIGHPVVALHRDRFGPLSLDGLKRGFWRELRADELDELKALTGEAHASC